MEYQKILNLLHNTPNQPFKFKTKKWVKINDESRRTYNADNQIRFKTSMFRSSLWDYSDAYILGKETITVAERTAASQNNANKKVLFKNCALFTNCISRIDNTQTDDAQDMPMYNLIEYSDNYSKTSGILWQFYRDVMAVDDDGAIIDFNAANNTTRLFNLK